MTQTPVQAAQSVIGDPYQWGAAGPAAFDCSGLTQWSWAQAGVKIPRTSQEQRNAGTVVALGQAQPGDLITYTYPGEIGNPGPGNHVGLYIGGGQMIDAPHAGANVRVDPIDTAHLDRVVHITGAPGSAVTTAAATGTGGAAAQDAGLSWSWNDLNPLTPLTDLGNAAGSVAGDVASGVVASLLKAAGPLMLTGLSLAAAGTLIVLGLWRMTEPTRQAVQSTAADAAKVAALA